MHSDRKMQRKTLSQEFVNSTAIACQIDIVSYLSIMHTSVIQGLVNENNI